jgi:hypothetical protein
MTSCYYEDSRQYIATKMQRHVTVRLKIYNRNFHRCIVPPIPGYKERSDQPTKQYFNLLSVFIVSSETNCIYSKSGNSRLLNKNAFSVVGITSFSGLSASVEFVMPGGLKISLLI